MCLYPKLIKNRRYVPKLEVVLSFIFENPDDNYLQNVDQGKVYDVTYVEGRELKHLIGKVIDIYKLFDTTEFDIYKIKFDSSSGFNASTATIKTDCIRSIKPYIKYGDEPTTIKNGTTTGGTTINGKCTNLSAKDVIIKDGSYIVTGKQIGRAHV